jgi:penicillin-binding protein 1C
MTKNTQNALKQHEMCVKKLLVCFSALIIAGAVLIGGPVYFFLLQPFPDIPSFEKVRTEYVQSEGKLLDRNGEVIHELRIHKQGRRLDWTALRDISPALQSAIISAEDHRFYRHRGVDWISLGAAFGEVFQSSRGRGASTITMQLAALQNENLRPDKSRRSFLQKSRQMRAARSFEKSWSKPQILEAYLNLVTFRGELQGIAAAARGLFSKEPQGLNSIEAAILGALLRSPNAGVQAVAARAFALAQALSLKPEYSEIETVTNEILLKPYRVRPQIALAPHIALRLFETARTNGKTPEVLSCTLDSRLQAFASEVLHQHILSARSQNMHDGSALVVDNGSGEVLAYIGNTGERSSAFYVDGIRAMRQAGSTLKPFVYALAFDRRLLTPVSLLEDDPLDVPVSGGVYRPKNYDNRFHGTVTARVALASSLNVPAVKILNLVGVDAFVDTLRLFGFENIRAAEFYGPSIALGSADVSLWDLVNAYRTIANGGYWSPLRVTLGWESGSRKRVVSTEAAFLISDILSDRESRSRTFDLESPLSTRFWTAVKTGTSKDMRDNWCVGFSDRYTVGVWAGNFSGEPMWNVSGITGAAPVWIEIMNQLHRRESSQKPRPPAELVQQVVDIAVMGQSRQEWFIKGTETASIQHAAGGMVPRIAYPMGGTVIAIDPDIPREDQMVFFQVKPQGGNLEWILDGRSFGKAAALTPWAPSRGKHILKLLDPTGKELDSIAFEVRGN